MVETRLELTSARRFRIALALGGVVACGPAAHAPAGPQPIASSEKVAAAPATAPAPPLRNAVILFIWDGLRPDSVDPRWTPNLARLRDTGAVDFRDHHAVYPTFTMMNAAAFATGGYPEKHGFFGNTMYQPGPDGARASGDPIDFSQPVFTEDYGVLTALDRFNRARGRRGLLETETLFGAAHAAGLTTAALGKTGPAFLIDYRLDGPRNSCFLDENIAAPFEFAQELLAQRVPLPKNSARFPFPNGARLELAPDNGDPSAEDRTLAVTLADGVTTDPRSPRGSTHAPRNRYLMNVFLDHVLPKRRPDLSLLWLRNPDSTEHGYGPGSEPYLAALKAQDELLGELLRKLAELGLRERTNLLIASDHGHSTIAGDPSVFPLRTLDHPADGSGKLGKPDPRLGYSVSGEIRTADLLRRAGFADVYDGAGCLHNPVLSGIRADGSAVNPARKDPNGDVCHAEKPRAQRKGGVYTTPALRAPAKLPDGAVVVAANGGSEYLYVPSRSRELVQRLVTALQERRVYGAVFVHDRYAGVPGTLPLSAIFAGTRDDFPTPDVIVSFDWDDQAFASPNQLAPGTEYASAQGNRGMHGSFSPIDVRATLIASGPDFKAGVANQLPSSNVDVAPTLAHLLGLSLPEAQGRVLTEALKSGLEGDYRVAAEAESAGPVALRRVCNPDDPACARPAPAASYRFTLEKKILTLPDGKTRYTYLDRAKATRETPASASATGGARKK